MHYTVGGTRGETVRYAVKCLKRNRHCDYLFCLFAISILLHSCCSPVYAIYSGDDIDDILTIFLLFLLFCRGGWRFLT